MYIILAIVIICLLYLGIRKFAFIMLDCEINLMNEHHNLDRDCTT